MDCHIVTLVFACILFCWPRPAKARFLAAVDKHKNSDAGRPHKNNYSLLRHLNVIILVLFLSLEWLHSSPNFGNFFNSVNGMTALIIHKLYAKCQTSL